MRAKTQKSPSRTIAYLLRVDRTLRRISFRRVGVTARKSAKPRRAAAGPQKRSPRAVSRAKPRVKTRAAKHVHTEKVAPGPRHESSIHLPPPVPLPVAEPSPQQRVPVDLIPARTAPAPSKSSAASARPWLVLGAVVILGSAVLIGARHPAPQSDDASRAEAVTAPVNADAPAESSTPPAAPIVPSTLPAAKPSPAVAPKTTFVSEAAFDKRATPEIEPPPVAPVRTIQPAPLATAPVAPAAAEVAAGGDAPVAITGCLERTNDGFVLQKTSGPQAPKSRSWKTGFLKSRTAKIDLVGPTEPLHLERFVGQRVTATGLLDSREMQPRSVTRLSGSCD